MSDDLINKILDLIKSGKGDVGRLNHIVETLKKGSALYASDKKYLESLFDEKNISFNDELNAKSESKVPSKTESEILKERLVKGEVSIEEYNLIKDLVENNSSKKPTLQKNKNLIFLLLASLPGLFGLQGIGYMYLKKYRRGAEVFVVSIIAVIVFFAIPYIDRSNSTVLPSDLSLRAIVVIFWLSVFAWQFYDSKKLYDEIVLDRRDKSYKSRKLRDVGRKYCLGIGGLGILSLIGIAISIFF